MPNLNDLFSKIQETLPTKEELEASARESYLLAAKNPNQFRNWYSAVLNSGVKTPRTKTFPFGYESNRAILKESLEALEECQEIQELGKKVNAVFDEFGVDVLFIKTGLYSGKHGWKDTCCLKRGDDVVLHIAQIAYDWAMKGSCESDELVVREMIPVEPAFHAFHGEMPVTEEYRLFANAGKVYAYQPYWPEDSIKEPSCEDWKEKLKAISTPSEELLSSMTGIAEMVTKELSKSGWGDDWSVDFLINKYGEPVLIDMALANQSYHSEDLREISNAG